MLHDEPIVRNIMDQIISGAKESMVVNHVKINFDISISCSLSFFRKSSLKLNFDSCAHRPGEDGTDKQKEKWGFLFKNFNSPIAILTPYYKKFYT